MIFLRTNDNLMSSGIPVNGDALEACFDFICNGWLIVQGCSTFSVRNEILDSI